MVEYILGCESMMFLLKSDFHILFNLFVRDFVVCIANPKL